MKITRYILLVLSLLLGQSAFAHSKAFTPEFVDALVLPYLEVQTQLAADELELSQAAADALLNELDQGPLVDDAKATLGALKKSATQINQADDLKGARAAFLELSTEMQSLVEHVGTASAPELFVAHCSMAFNGQGAVWLQSSRTIANPYWGAMMLRCGSIEENSIQSKK